MNWLRSTAALGFLGGVVLAGGNDSARYEEIVKSMLTVMGNLTKTLTTITDDKDGQSARLAQRELKKSAEQWVILRKKAESVPPPSTEEGKKLKKLYESKLTESQKLLFGEIARVQQIPGGREALADLAKAFAPEKKSGN
jgi:hypothetical protein